ncbi:MAG: nitrous oxide reductase family maturation protein NosD, partial [Chromatiales bacterium]|nr:nitrous oxide reductase family maturation protein NosD [Chromatiales bacterium]
DVEVSGNQVLYCATGLYLDVSPFQPDTTNRIFDNLIAYSCVGILFLNDWTGNILKGNSLQGNITQVVVSGGKTANRNVWEGNYWDDFEGFDQDGDMVGDSPYELYSYADRIWMDVPAARFFKGSPVLEVLDFLERLAPFSDPNMLVRDKKPLMVANVTRESGVKNNSELEGSGTEEQPQADQSGTEGAGSFDALKALQESLKN